MKSNAYHRLNKGESGLAFTVEILYRACIIV